MNVRAHVRVNFPMDGFDLAVVRNDGVGPEAWHPSGTWTSYDPTVTNGTPWITFSGPVAAAVLEAMERHMRSAAGYVATDARSDYLAERARVDKLTDALVSIATEARR